MAINPSFNHKISPNSVAFNFIPTRYSNEIAQLAGRLVLHA